MQNESNEIKTLLLGILELALVDDLQVNDQTLTPEDKTDVIGTLALETGKHLGFTAEELFETLKNPNEVHTRKAIELVARVAIDIKEYQKNGKTRN